MLYAGRPSFYVCIPPYAGRISNTADDEEMELTGFQ